MPKLKTHKGAAKRFKISGTGKVIKFKAYRRHILEKKSPKRKRYFRQSEPLEAGDQKKIKKLLPYL